MIKQIGISDILRKLKISPIRLRGMVMSMTQVIVNLPWKKAAHFKLQARRECNNIELGRAFTINRNLGL